jgi:membrane-associated phospholipid phosphatase
MAVSPSVSESQNYFSQLLTLARRSAVQLVRPASDLHRAEATTRLRRQTLWLIAIGAVAVVALLFIFDATEIGLMPRRGTPSLWPLRILTDFGNDAYVLWLLAAALVVVALVCAGLRGKSRARWLSLATQVEYLFFAVLFPLLITEIVKWTVGRGRPFVGGKANPFNFVPFTGTEAYFSFPSAHAVTSFALAFAVGAIWPRARGAMFAYAGLIAATRLVLLAHHPSDVVAGAVIGVSGAMAVRYWFAVRGLGFAVHANGEIVPL